MNSNNPGSALRRSPGAYYAAVLLIGIVISCSTASPQSANIRIPLTVSDSSGYTTTLAFGVHPLATHCTDPGLGEFQLPPDWCFPGGCFPCAAFVDNRPGNYDCFGEGMQLDLRQFSSTAQTDTYKIGFQTNCPPIVVHWPWHLSSYYDSARIQDPFGGAILNVNMFLTDSLIMAEPYDRFLIHTWGPHGVTCAPPSTRTWLFLSENGAGSDTLWFGFAPNATCLVDTQLCEYLSIPCDPPGFFCTQWLPVCWHSYWETMGNNDYRASRGLGAIDTFLVSFQTQEPEAPVLVKWSRAAVSSLCDSAVLRDAFGGTFCYARMDLADSLLVSSPVTRLRLITYGQKTAAIHQHGEHPPGVTSLLQNYPNPANPVTTITFELGHSSHVRLRVYNVLGQEVARLIDAPLAAGRHRVEFHGNGLASGVYYYHLETEEFSSIKKMLLLR